MSRTQKIINIGLLIALSIVLTRLLSFYILPTIRVSFGDIPIMISGIIMGPWAGAVTGGLSDIIGMLMFPSPTGGYFPGFTLSKILVGIIPALIVRFVKKPGLFRMAAAVILTEIVCSLCLDTIWLSVLYNKGVLVLLPPRIITRAVITVMEIPFIYAITGSVKKVLHLDNI